MSEEALVDGKNALGANSFKQAIEHALVKVASLVVHTRHNGV